MNITQIPFKDTGFFSKTMLDYLEQSKKIKPFYGNFSDLSGFKQQIIEKQRAFSSDKRSSLVKTLKNQYKNTNYSEKTIQNITLLKDNTTFTVTTGHQLNLFTGPLYFLYKIITTINLCEELKTNFPNKNFVPIYWMATEDHDFEEINYFNFKDKKIKWNSEQTGAVGRFSTAELKEVYRVLSLELNTSKNADFLRELFKKGYTEHHNLADATRYVANALFGKYGLVILDADDRTLKTTFSPYMKEELLHQTAFKEVLKTIEKLEKNYKIQVNPREINLFYLTDTSRERIVLENKRYKINNTNISFSLEEILQELKNNPERFSPNVIMRPLYQEVILPNLCYIGGGGELAYWLELKNYFKAVKVPFPILLLRNSVQIISEKQYKKLNKIGISTAELFLEQDELIAKKVTEKATAIIEFSKQKECLERQFSELRDVAKQTDKSFIGAVNAQEKKQLKGLNNLQKRWLRAEKRQQKELVNRIKKLHNELFPNHSLEERQRNFSMFYQEYGNEFITTLKENLQPLQLQFSLLFIS